MRFNFTTSLVGALLQKRNAFLFAVFTLLFFTLATQKSYAQCTNASSRPNDTYTLVGWAPRCNGGNDGFIRITGIGSTIGSYTNGPYTARILTAVGGTVISTHPIPAGNTTFDITGLTSGNYFVDIMDQCGGTSSSKLVTVTSIVANTLLVEQPVTGFSFITRKTDITCGDTYTYKSRVQYLNNGQTVTVTFTNHSGATREYFFTPGRIPIPLPLSTSLANTTDIDLSSTFFDGFPITVTASNGCGVSNTATIQNPFANNFVISRTFIIGGAEIPVQSATACVFGYNIRRVVRYGVNPITATIIETASPLTPVLDIDGVVVPNFNGNINYGFYGGTLGGSAADAGTTIFSRLKYNTEYRITYTDACGQIFEEILNTPSPLADQAVAVTGCATSSNIATPFVDGTGFISINLNNANLLKSPPYTYTVNTGPATWNSSLGLNAVSANITYPFSFTSNTHLFTLGSNDPGGGVNFAPGTYNITYRDACGNTNTVNVTVAACANTISKTLDYCSQNNGTVNLKYQVNSSSTVFYQRFSIYNSSGVAIQTVNSSGDGSVLFSGLDPGSYTIRFGGVDAVGAITNFRAIPNIPRLVDGYIYEEAIVIAGLNALSLAPVTTCNGNATAVGSGGLAPLTYTLLNQAGTIVLQPAQSSGIFSGLTEGTTYTMRLIDNCGRTFNQAFTVASFVNAPTIGTVVQPTCASLNNSVTLTNLPSGNWTITDSNGGGTTTGTGASVTLNNIAAGAHTFSVAIAGGCTSVASSSVNILSSPIYPTEPIVGSITQGTCATPTGSVTLTGLPATGNYTITDTSNGATYINLSGTSTTITNLTAGKHNFEVTNAGSCTSPTASTDVDILPIPALNLVITNPAAVCGSGTVDITAASVTAGSTAGLTYTYFTDNLGTIALANPNAITVSNTYYIKASNGTCTDIKAVVVTINPLPTTPIVSPAGPTTICPSTSLVLSSTAATSYQWYKGGVLIGGATSQTYSANATGVYTVVVKDANCFSAPSNAVSVTVEDVTPPVATGSVTTTVEGCSAASAPAAVTTTAALQALGYAISDNCTVDANLVITYTDVVAGTCPIVVTRTYHIKDASNNSTDIVQTININDTTKPVITGTITATTVEGCSAASAPAAVTTVAALEAMGLAISDNCTADALLTVSHVDVVVAGACATAITRTYTITDACGNFQTVSQTININDTTKPVISGTITSTTVQGCSAASAPAAVTNVAALEAMGLVISDNCTADALLTVSYVDVTAGTCPIVVTRTYTITDACGNSQTVVHTINIDDTTKPVITGTIATTTIEGCSAASAPAAVTTVAALEAMGLAISDNCTADALLTVSHTDATAGTCPMVLTRVYTITDACGNFRKIIQTINIQDTTKPVITGTIATTTVEGCTAATVSAETTVAGLEALGLVISDNCTTDALLTVSYVDVATGTCPIVVTRTYTITDACGNFETVSQTINIIDTTKPKVTGTIATITVEGCSAASAPVAATTVAELEAMGLFIADNCTPISLLTISYVDVAAAGACATVVTRTYRITDACGNFQTVIQTININDTTKPVITGTIIAITTQGCSAASAPAAVTTVAALEAMGLAISDNCTADALLTVSHVDAVAAGACASVITRTYTITDACGNFQTVTQTINIQDKTKPIITGAIAATTVEGCSAASAPAAVTTVAALEAMGLTISDNCTTSALLTVSHVDVTAGTCPIVVTRTYTITDACGNFQTVTHTINIQDTTAPTFVQPLPVDITANCNAVPIAVILTATDNCSTAIVTFTEVTASNMPVVGQSTLTRTWIATDACGNTTTHTQKIIIPPLPIPIVTVTAQPTCSVGTGTITITPVAGASYSVDGGPYTTLTTYNLAPGEHTITVRSADGCVSSTVTITINPQPALPTASIKYNPAEYQAVGTAQVIQIGQTGGSYTSSPTGLIINPTTGQLDLANSTPNQTYTVTYSFGNGNCTDTTTTTVRINSRPATITYGSPVYCAIGTAKIVSTGPTGGSYTSAPNGLVINSSTGEVNLETSKVGSYTVTYTYKDGSVTASTTTTITINALPELTITSDIPTGYMSLIGDVVTLTATGGITYTWAGDDILSGQGTSILKVRLGKNNTYIVIAKNENGCSSTAQITLAAQADYKLIPNNVITPNGDGKNDTWVIKNINYYPNNTVTIYDRAGRKLYSVKDYKNDWGGTYNGQPLAEDAYIYVIDSGKGFGLLRGTVNIIRDQR
ncbi:MAG: gliding motility-associated C-terminal domain-containing protein [Sphingobacteriaceae bacterium]|nr:gliding motility-associated C-terminal domain-containing protein [Sphingobacteriaceae bacterium]